MKNAIRKGVLIGLVSALLFAAVPAFAGTNWINFATNLPRFQGWTDLASDYNINDSDAQAYVSNVGSDYKVNLVIYQGSNKVSNTAYDIDDGQTVPFIVDNSAVGKTITLKGQAARWSIVEVEVSGKFKADTR